MELPDSTRLLKALGDETRLRILNLLSSEELHGSDLMEILNMGQSRVSTHVVSLSGSNNDAPPSSDKSSRRRYVRPRR